MMRPHAQPRPQFEIRLAGHDPTSVRPEEIRFPSLRSTPAESHQHL